jgi:hypothetical protein
MVYEKKPNYPSHKKPGVYPSGSLKELGLNNDDLEKFSLGNWNSITKNNRKFFVPISDSELSNFFSGNIPGRPVRVRNIRPTDLPFEIEIDGVEYQHTGFFSQRIITHSTRTDLRFVMEPNINESPGYLYNTFDLYSGENDDLDWSESEKQQIIIELSQRYESLLNIIRNNTAYILPNDVSIDDLSEEEIAETPMRLVFSNEAQEQIDEILNDSFTLERKSMRQDSIQRLKNQLETNEVDFPEDWPIDGNSIISNSFQLYINPPTQHDDGTPLISSDTERYAEDDYIWNKYTEDEDSGARIYLNQLTIREIYSVGEGMDRILTFFYSKTRDGENVYTNFLRGVVLPDQEYTSGYGEAIQFGHPNYLTNFPLTDENSANLIPETVDFKVFCTTNESVEENIQENESTNFLYYDNQKNLLSYNDTSYPVKVNLSLSVLGDTVFDNRDIFELEPDYNQERLESSLIRLFFQPPSDQIETLQGESLGNIVSTNQSVFYYKVIQWGDEKKLLTDEQILNSEYFKLYDIEQYPENNNFYFKKYQQNLFNKVDEDEINYSDMVKSKNFKPIKNKSGELVLSSHSYTQPGIQSIKIVILRFPKNLSIVTETILVTKKIVINDGNLTTQDFSTFGGTDFNFLPIGENQAIIGGLDDSSNYNNSVSKIVKDDNFVQEDYLERVSSKDYIQKFNNGLLGKTPGQLDLSQTRVFTEPRDIYDFIGGDKLEWINQGSGSLPLDSLATDIFISDDKCVVDLNPPNSDFSVIQNQSGTTEVGILIGDYKLNQSKDGRIEKEGLMSTPSIDTKKDRQAF